MTKSMENPGTIYTEEKKIEDSDIARAIADKEENFGRKAARGLEQEFEQEAKMGGKKLREAAKEEMNTTEEYLTKLINKLHEKFPLVPSYPYEDGRCFLVPFEGNGPKYESIEYWLLNKDGMFEVKFITSVPVPCSSIDIGNVIKKSKRQLDNFEAESRRSGLNNFEQKLKTGFEVYFNEESPPVDVFKYRAESRYAEKAPLSFCLKGVGASDYANSLGTIARAFESEQQKYKNIANAKEREEKDKREALASLEKL